MTPHAPPAPPAPPVKGTAMTTSLLGVELTADEQTLFDVYEQLKSLSTRDGLSPCVDANVKEALSNVAIAVTDLGIVFEHLTDYDC